MAELNGSRAELARYRTESKAGTVGQRDAAVRKDRDKALAAAVAKTARLKALRLAKEAEEREAAAQKPKASRRAG
jgi:hypothetical protein